VVLSLRHFFLGNRAAFANRGAAAFLFHKPFQVVPFPSFNVLATVPSHAIRVFLPIRFFKGINLRYPFYSFFLSV